MSILGRLDIYVGRDKEKELLRRYSQLVSQQAHCYALYFQAKGGLGKTHLLDRYPQILDAEDGSPDANMFGSLRIGRVIDFYSFESRNPQIIEQRLIEGLKQSTAHEWYLLPATRVDTVFEIYAEALKAYRDARDSGHLNLAAERATELRRTFIDCWNRLAEIHPLVMRFDTVEALFSPQAPSQAIINIEGGTTGLDLVMEWFSAVLPHLHHTLVLLSGRQVADNHLVIKLQEVGVLAESIWELTPFDKPADIRAYLSAYGYTVSNDNITHLQRITEGRPLLLTLYAETRRPAWAIPPALPFHYEIGSRAEFEDALIETVLNPMEIERAYSRSESTLAYCLYFLFYARRGLRREQLHDLFNEIGLVYESRVIDEIDPLSLVKRIGDRLYLHDEIFVMIDQSGKPDELNLRIKTLDYLCMTSRPQVHEATEHAALLGGMTDNLYYELTRDIREGYRIYTIYADWLLRERRINALLVLSDMFWSTLNLAVQRDSEVVHPYLDALAQAGPSLSMSEILRDEEVRQVKLLRAQDKHEEAFELAERLHNRLVAEGLLPGGDDELPGGNHDQYLYVDLTITHAIVIAQARPAGYERRIEMWYSRVIELLQNEAAIADPLLKLRRLAFLGQTYMLRGYLYYQQQRFSEGEADEERGRIAFRTYREKPVVDESTGRSAPPEQLLNDRVISDLAQITNNLAYNLAWSGKIKRALRLSDEVIQHYLPYASDYQRALFYNTNALIRIRYNQLAEAAAPIRAAEVATQQLGRSRARGLVAQGLGQYERERMKVSGEPMPQFERYYQEAADLLQHESSSLREVYYDWAGFLRDLALLYQQLGNEAPVRGLFEQSLALFGRALGLLADEPSMQRADLLQSQATIFNQMGQYDRAAELLNQAEAMMDVSMPEYGQVVAGKIAIQRAYLAEYHQHDGIETLRQMAIALARTYVFARQHRDQAVFEQLIDRRIPSLSEADLRAFETATQSDRLYVTVDNLPYQRPDGARWASAWEDSIQFINDSIDRIATRL